MALFPALLLIIHMATSSCRTISFESLEGSLESSDPAKKLADIFLPLLEHSEPKSIKRIELSEYNGDEDKKKKRLKKFEQYGKKHLVQIAPLSKNKDKTPLAIIVTAPGISKKKHWKTKNKEYKEYADSSYDLEDFFREARQKATDIESQESKNVSNEVSNKNDDAHLKLPESSEKQIHKNAADNSTDETVKEIERKHETEHTDSSDSEKSKSNSKESADAPETEYRKKSRRMDSSESDDDELDDKSNQNIDVRSSDESENKKVDQSSKSNDKYYKKSEEESKNQSDDKSAEYKDKVDIDHIIKKQEASDSISAEKKLKEKASQSISYEHLKTRDNTIEEKDTSETETKEYVTYKEKHSEESFKQASKEKYNKTKKDKWANESNEKHKNITLSNSDSQPEDDDHKEDKRIHVYIETDAIQEDSVNDSPEKIKSHYQMQSKEDNDSDSSKDWSNEVLNKKIHHNTKPSQHVINEDEIINHHSIEEKSSSLLTSSEDSHDDFSEVTIHGDIDESKDTSYGHIVARERIVLPEGSSEEIVDRDGKNDEKSENPKHTPETNEQKDSENIDIIHRPDIVEIKHSTSESDSEDDVRNTGTLESKDISYFIDDSLDCSNETEYNISDESKIDSLKYRDHKKNEADITIKESVETYIKPKRSKEERYQNRALSMTKTYGSQEAGQTSQNHDKKSVNYNTNKSYKLSFLFNK